MALTILYTVDRADDFKSISVADNNTEWGSGGNPGTGDVTAITLEIFGIDKINPQKSVVFTSSERTTFLSGSAVTFNFSDSRLWETTYAPDNFYTTKLVVEVSTGSVVATLVPFDSYFFLYKLINEHAASVDVTLDTYYEANRQVTGDNVAIDILEYLSSELSVARENKWRKIYDFLAWNYDIE